MCMHHMNAAAKQPGPTDPSMGEQAGSNVSDPIGSSAARPATRGIRDFIQSECPVMGPSGRPRERLRAATMECTLLGVPLDEVVVPGCQLIWQVGYEVLEQVVRDGGQVSWPCQVGYAFVSVHTMPARTMCISICIGSDYCMYNNRTN